METIENKIKIENKTATENKMATENKITTYNSDETLEFAKKFAKSLVGGDIITLDGELGAGKTLFTKGLATGLNIAEPILSPTFTIMNEYYSGKLNLYHFDVYRLSSGDEAIEAGLDEYIGKKDGVTVIEWSQNIIDLIKNRKIIKIKIKILDENIREIEIA